MKKDSVCWNITSRCNENCQFCYRIMCRKENTYEQNDKILDMLIKLKINKISWTGGEALLYPHLFDLMKKAHYNNIKNNIITNGRLLTPNIIDKIEEYTDYITFSLDALNDNVNNCLGRGIEHGKNIIELLEYLKNKNIIVKLNSIVTKKNINNIIEVAQIVNDYKIKRWKLYKYISLRGKSIENKSEFEIDNEIYENLISEIKKQKMNCPIVVCREKEIEENYILINPIGDFIITINSKDKVMCNFETIEKINIEEEYDEFRRKLGFI